MNQIFLTLFFLANILNISGKTAPSQQSAQVKLQAPVLDVSNFKLVTKKLPEDVIGKISATNVFVKEIGGAVIYDKNSEDVRPIASLTKLMTGLIALQIYHETEQLKISEKAVNMEGEAGLFSPGEVFERNDLVKAAVVASSNDAAYSLAEKAGVEKFVEYMNAKAKELRMEGTQYVDPTGLSKNNKSSLGDLYILIDHISRTYPEILNFSKIESFTLTGSRKRTIENIDYLLPVYKRYIVASKTGFTNDAGECLVLVLKFEKSPFVFAGLLNSKNRFDDAKKLILALKEYYK